MIYQLSAAAASFPSLFLAKLLLMHPAIPLLLELQKTDSEIAALRANLEAAPKRIRENEAKLNGARAAVAAAKEAQAQFAASHNKTKFKVSACREPVKKFTSPPSPTQTT